MNKPLTSDESRRAGIYRSLSRVKGWEDALKVRYQYWRGKSVECGMQGTPAQAYLNGRADSWEEIIEIIKSAKLVWKQEQAEEI